MAGRAFAFADPEIIAQAQTLFVPCCIDDWYQRRRQDDEGKFFRSVADQPGGRTGKGGSTRQGIYVLTPDGDLLAYKNAGDNVEATQAELALALRKWVALPAARRTPGGVSVPKHGKLDPNFSRVPPEGGLVLKVHGRILAKKGESYAKGECGFTGGDKASRDFAWLTAAEAKAMVPARREVGQTVELPAAVARRLVRFHLVDNTRGEPEFWEASEVRRQKLTLTVTADTADAVELRLDGDVLLSTEADADRAARGFEAKLYGTLRYRPAKQAFDRWDVVALGEHWGSGAYTKTGERVGRAPLGISLELADPTIPAERVPPQAARERDRYFGRE